MTDTKAGARPSQVTMAGWTAVVGSALLVLTLLDSMSRIRSLETRNSIDAFLSTPPGNGMGLTVPEVVDLMRGAMMVAGAAAAAATVLAVYVLRRHNAARVGFTVAAVAIVLSAPMVGFLPVLIAFAASMLWTKPARDWFAGRPPAVATAGSSGRLLMSEGERPDGADRPRPSDAEQPSQQPQQPEQPQPGQPQPPGGSAWPHMPGPGAPGGQVPPPTPGFGSPQPSPWAARPYPAEPQQPPYGHPGYLPYGYGPPKPFGYGQDPDRRPLTVTLAAVITWLFTGLTTVIYLAVVGMLLFSRDRLVELIQQDPQLSGFDISTSDLIAALWVMSAVVILWCLVAIVLAVLAFRRQNWARYTLAVSAGVTALVSLLAFPAGLVHMLAAGAVVALLFTGGANEWYARRGASSYPPQQYGGQGGYPGQAGGYPEQAGGYPGQVGGYPGQPGPSYPGQPGGPSYPGQPGPTYPDQGPDQGTDDGQEPPKNVW